jgi:hypothetical protein
MTGADHTERRTDIMHESNVDVFTKPDSSAPIDTAQLVLDSPHAATAAKFERPSETEILRQLQQLEVSLSIFDRSSKERMSLQGNHPTLGLLVEPHEDLKNAVVVTQMMSGTTAAKIPRWRRRYLNSIIQEIEGQQVTTPQDVTTLIRDARLARKQRIKVTFGGPQRSSRTSDEIPQLHFDQLNVIAHHLHALRTGEDQWNQKDNIRRTGIFDALETTTHTHGPLSRRRQLNRRSSKDSQHRSVLARSCKHRRHGLDGANRNGDSFRNMTHRKCLEHRARALLTEIPSYYRGSGRTSTK